MQKKLINKKSIETVSFFVGGIGIFVAGLIYVLIADLFLKVRSAWLMSALILCLCSCIFFIMSGVMKDYPKKMIFFKSLGIAFCVFFIALMVTYLIVAFGSTYEENTTEFENNLFALEAIFGRNKRVNTQLAGITPIVVGTLALICQVLCLVLGLLSKNED